MFPFQRPPCPDYLAECWEALGVRFDNSKRQNPEYKFRWYKAFKYEETRKRLNEMTKGHCAFCDGGDLGAVSRETIEHFKPKSEPEFRRLAFNWENLYPCCDKCQSEKLQHFDERLLVADAADYQFNDFFMVDYTSGALEPNTSSSPQQQERAAITIEHYGLNLSVRMLCRKKELKRYQQRVVEEDALDDFSYRYFLMDA